MYECFCCLLHYSPPPPPLRKHRPPSPTFAPEHHSGGKPSTASNGGRECPGALRPDREPVILVVRCRLPASHPQRGRTCGAPLPIGAMTGSSDPSIHTVSGLLARPIGCGVLALFSEVMVSNPMFRHRHRYTMTPDVQHNRRQVCSI